jgi:hypothetical protein
LGNVDNVKYPTSYLRGFIPLWKALAASFDGGMEEAEAHVGLG